MQAPAVVVTTPLARVGACILEHRQDLAGEAIVADAGYGAFDPSFVPGMSYSRRIDVQVAPVRTLETRA